MDKASNCHALAPWRFASWLKSRFNSKDTYTIMLYMLTNCVSPRSELHGIAPLPRRLDIIRVTVWNLPGRKPARPRIYPGSGCSIVEFEQRSADCRKRPPKIFIASRNWGPFSFWSRITITKGRKGMVLLFADLVVTGPLRSTPAISAPV